MFITHDVLVDALACNEGIAFVDKFYPNGAEMETLIRHRNIPYEFLHWGYMHLPYNDKERAAYYDVLKVENSTPVYKSDHITDSSYISTSSNVINSHHIFFGKNILNSSAVVSSQVVENSEGIFNSQFVYDSNGVLYSANIQKSNSIVNGSYIIESTNTFNSSLITRSSELRDCTNIQDSAMLVNCTDSARCLFCSHISNKEYCLFNATISPEQFKFTMDRYWWFRTNESGLFEDWDKEMINPQVPMVHYDYRLHYGKWLDNQLFMDWLKSLPHYNSQILYEIFYSPNFLK